MRQTLTQRITQRFTTRLRLVLSMTAVGSSLTLSACSPADFVGVRTPYGILDKDVVNSPSGALGLYHNANTLFSYVFSGGQYFPQATYLVASGVFTDELQAGSYGSLDPSLDARAIQQAVQSVVGTVTYVTDYLYNHLQYSRVNSGVAAEALARFLPEDSAMRARVRALEGYATVLLGDFFCSGVPLSTVPLDGDFTYDAGTPTREVYLKALALFDSTVALGHNDPAMLNLGRIGRARVLLQLERYAEAAASVASVPSDYMFAVESNPAVAGGGNLLGTNSAFVSVTDREGGTGMPWKSAMDPRVVVGAQALAPPTKYTSPYSRVRLATGIEARLIQAEADLQAGGTTWLSILNALRTDGSFTTAGDDTLWSLGSGRVEGQTRGLAPLTDPGTAAARLDLLFRERAFWLYLTGQRQGDLRRLVRNYKRDPNSVYPSGAYVSPVYVFGTPIMSYGNDVVTVIPNSERINNPKFTGCLDTNA